MANPSGSCCCGSTPAKGCHCDPSMPWTVARVTISGVSDPGPGFFCWNTYTHFNGTVWAPFKTNLLPQFDGITSTDLTGCVDSFFHTFTRYTLRVLPGVSCLVQNDPAPSESATYTCNCRVELTYYFLGTDILGNPTGKEVALPPVVIGVQKTQVVVCGTKPTFQNTIQPINGPLGTQIQISGEIEVAFQ